MLGPDDLKVGKTDIIDKNGTRVVTETTNENTLDGKSIWTISQEFDYDNDGTMDAFKRTTQTYDANTGKLLEQTSIGNKWRVEAGLGDTPDTDTHQYLYETKTGNLVKENYTSDYNSDGIPDERKVTRYRYNDKGQVIKKSEFKKENDVTDGKPNITESYTYYDNGEVKTKIHFYDAGADGKLNEVWDEKVEYKYNEKGTLISFTETHGSGHTSETKCDANGKWLSRINTHPDGWAEEVKFDKSGNVVSRTVLKEPDQPSVQEEPAKAEEKQGYEIPTYKPYSQDNDKKHPPMMGI